MSAVRAKRARIVPDRFTAYQEERAAKVARATKRQAEQATKRETTTQYESAQLGVGQHMVEEDAADLLKTVGQLQSPSQDQDVPARFMSHETKPVAKVVRVTKQQARRATKKKVAPATQQQASGILDVEQQSNKQCETAQQAVEEDHNVSNLRKALGQMRAPAQREDSVPARLNSYQAVRTAKLARVTQRQAKQTTKREDAAQCDHQETGKCDTAQHIVEETHNDTDLLEVLHQLQATDQAQDVAAQLTAYEVEPATKVGWPIQSETAAGQGQFAVKRRFTTEHKAAQCTVEEEDNSATLRINLSQAHVPDQDLEGNDIELKPLAMEEKEAVLQQILAAEGTASTTMLESMRLPSNLELLGMMDSATLINPTPDPAETANSQGTSATGVPYNPLPASSGKPYHPGPDKADNVKHPEYCRSTFSSKENMADPYVQFVRAKYLRGSDDDAIVVQRLSLDVCEAEFISKHLYEVEVAGGGHFSQPHTNKIGLVKQFYCERHSKPKGRRKLATETRANGCNAYISFRFVEDVDKRAVIIRYNPTHNGHDLTAIDERKVSPVDSALTVYIEELLSQNLKPAEIIPKCWKWIKARGRDDFHDRRFTPTLTDISAIASAFRNRSRLHKNDSVAVEILCTEIMKDKIVYYQQLNKKTSTPLVIVYQNNEQFGRMRKFGDNVVFLDATYKGLTAYGYAFYCLVARDEAERGTPLCYIITSDDTQETLRLGLQKLTQHTAEKGYIFSPRCFMIDKDTKEFNALREVFPMSDVLYCWFHVLQAIYRWLNKTGSGVTGVNNAPTRKDIVDYIRFMRVCTAEHEFVALASNIPAVMPTEAVAKYLCENWVKNGHMWAMFGRRFSHKDQDTNNLVERFFLALKKQHFGGIANQRVETLLKKVDEEVEDFYQYMENLYKAGRITTSKRTQRSKLAAEQMLAQDWAQKTVWVDDTKCVVESQRNPSEVYHVNLIHCTCTCIAAAQEGLCKHFHVAATLAAARSTDIVAARKERAAWILQMGTYHLTNYLLEVIDPTDGEIGVVDTRRSSCLCIAFSHNIKCVCLQVAEMLLPRASISAEENPDETQLPVEQKQVKESAVLSLKQKLREITDWVSTIDEVDEAELMRVKPYVHQLHTAIHGRHQKRFHHRKNQPLHAYRKSIEVAKRAAIKPVDHGYNEPVVKGKYKSQPKAKRNLDGSYKMSNRAKRSTRKSYAL